MNTNGSILVVDYTPESLTALTDMLVAEGYDVRAADSGALALASVAAQSPELILLDIRMPGVDGLEVLRQLRARTAGCDIPIVFVSASNDMSDRVAGLKMGAVDFLSKPIHREELLARVHIHLDLRRLRVQFERQADDLRQANGRLARELAERQADVATVDALHREAQASRKAALNLMDDAVEARNRLETSNRELRREIADRKLAETRERLGHETLDLLNGPNAAEDAIRQIVETVRKTTQIEAVGLRLREGDDFPYYVTSGFPDQFVHAERSLCARDDDGHVVRDTTGRSVLECMCGNIISGRTEPSLPFFTRGGSFWSNGTTQLLASTTEADRLANTRDRCNGEGYESVALIPLRVGGAIIGLLQLNDHRPDQFTPQMIEFLEGLGASIGIALARQKSEVALRESEAHYRAVMESANDAIITADSDRKIQDWNPAAERMFGYSEREARGRPLSMLNPERFSDRKLGDVLEMADAANTHLMGSRVELEGRRKDGSEFPLELSVSEWSTPAGRHSIGVIGDITARKHAEAEKAKLEAQYRQAQKMESVGRLAGGVAHDFNNMLAIISGYTDLAMMKLDPAGPIHADLKEVTKAAKRSAALVRQLLAFARQQTITPRVLDINETVEHMLTLLRRLIGEDVDLVWKPGTGLRPVNVDPSQIDQVMANLVANARDAIAGTGRVNIESTSAVFDDAYCADHPGAVAGQYVQLTISDDGCGMDKETAAQVFEPFFTTKPEGKGTGLGLSTVYGIVKQNAGFISIYSEPGQGTTVRVYLPVYESESRAEQVPPVSVDASSGSETVLLVEDEEALLALCKRTLEHLGYTVLATASPLHAIDLFKNYPGEIHLLLTDVVMPEMNGRDLQCRLEALRPGLKCLFTSAYTADVIAHRGVLDSEVNFLQKPYSWQTLATKVREVLGRRQPETPLPATDHDLEIPV